jgi:hypothetical protein
MGDLALLTTSVRSIFTLSATDKVILGHYHYRSSIQERQPLSTKAQQVVRVDSKPVYVFRELLYDLATQRIVSPAVSCKIRLARR